MIRQIARCIAQPRSSNCRLVAALSILFRRRSTTSVDCPQQKNDVVDPLPYSAGVTSPAHTPTRAPAHDEDRDGSSPHRPDRSPGRIRSGKYRSIRRRSN